MMSAHMSRRDFLQAVASGAIAAASRSETQNTRSEIQSGGQLKKAVLISMLPKSLSYYERFKLALDVGFQGIEAQTVADEKEADEIKEAAEKAGVRIHSVMNMNHWRYPLSSPDAAQVELSIKNVQTSLRNAKLWGADAVLLVPAVVTERVRYQEAYVRSQKQIRRLIPLAKELNVIIAVEEVWNKFLLSPLEFARYVDEFNSPWVKAYFDIGNIMLYGYPQDWIRTLGKRIVKFHVKDFDLKTKQFVPLLEGDVDWPEVRRAIAEIGYSGFLTVELREGDKDYLLDVSRRLDKIIAGN